MCLLGFIGTPVTSTLPPARGELAALRRVRDRLDREHARPLDVDALARDAGLSPRALIHSFEIAYGRSPYSYLLARRAEPTPCVLQDA